MECQEAAVFSGDISCWTGDEDAKKLDEEALYKLVKLDTSKLPVVESIGFFLS